MADQKETIADDDVLFRRVIHYFITADNRISSAAFKEKGKLPEALSVDIARLTTATDCLDRGLPGMCLVRLIAGVPRSLGLSVTHEPKWGNWAHAEIRGEFKKEVCAKLADASEIEV